MMSRAAGPGSAVAGVELEPLRTRYPPLNGLVDELAVRGVRELLLVEMVAAEAQQEHARFHSERSRAPQHRGQQRLLLHDLIDHALPPGRQIGRRRGRFTLGWRSPALDRQC